MKALYAALAVGAALLALTACTSSRSITLPDGREGHLIGCGGLQNILADCYAKAAEICRRGYRTEEYGIGNPFPWGYNNGAVGESLSSRALVVSCR